MSEETSLHSSQIDLGQHTGLGLTGERLSAEGAAALPCALTTQPRVGQRSMSRLNMHALSSGNPVP